MFFWFQQLYQDFTLHKNHHIYLSFTLGVSNWQNFKDSVVFSIKYLQSGVLILLFKIFICFKSHYIDYIIFLYNYQWSNLSDRYWDSLGLKSHARKIRNNQKDFDLYQVFMHNFLYQNVPMFLLYILLTVRIDTFCYEGIYTKMSPYPHLYMAYK